MAPNDDNRRIFEDAGVIDMYRGAGLPHPSELTMFEHIGDDLKSARLLDIGVGAGRTTSFLAPKVAHYVGVDYSHGLVEAASQLYPDTEFHWCDARDMSVFGDASFDVANFSFNGLDALDHTGRIQVLSEVRRILKPGGHWMFASHNRDYVRRGLLPWQGRRKPGRVMLKKSAEALQHHRNWRRLRKEQVETTDYALVNDEAHEYSLLHYYISPQAQAAQLRAAGFTDVRVYDQSGRETTEPSPASVWMYYASRRT